MVCFLWVLWITRPSLSSCPTDVAMLGFKPRCYLCLFTKQIEQQWLFLMFCITSLPTFGYFRFGPNISKCKNNFTNRPQTFRFYISTLLRIVRMVLRVLDVLNYAPNFLICRNNTLVSPQTFNCATHAPLYANIEIIQYILPANYNNFKIISTHYRLTITISR